LTDDAAGWRVEFARAAQRDLRRLDPPINRRVLAAIEGLLADPPQGDVKRLTGASGEYRLRVGDWRIRFTRDLSEQVIVIERVLPRGRAYRD
jgi:mRNA interferase RelE/StbE